MINYAYPYHQLQGVSEIADDAGASIPDHYLVPTSKTAIDIYIGKLGADWKHTDFYTPCKADWDGESYPCTIVLLDIERYNLYFVNKIISYDELIAFYNRASEAIENIPHIPTLKEQLRDVGKFLIGTVAGFFTAGPVGLFTGGAAAVGEILEREKARRADKIKSMLNPMLTDAQQADELIKAKERNAAIEKYGLWGAGVLAVSGIVFWMLSD